MLFINASEHYEKGKRQNHLRDKDIAKIVDVYKYRKEEERYSRCVPTDEIRKNEYNLNITRYVSTAEPEKPVDLAAVHKDLRECEGKAEEARNRYNEFLKELGLPELPKSGSAKGKIRHGNS